MSHTSTAATNTTTTTYSKRRMYDETMDLQHSKKRPSSSSSSSSRGTVTSTTVQQIHRKMLDVEPKAKRVLQLEMNDNNTDDYDNTTDQHLNHTSVRNGQQQQQQKELFPVEDKEQTTTASTDECNENGNSTCDVIQKKGEDVSFGNNHKSRTKYNVRSIQTLYRDNNRRTNDEIHSSINLGPVISCIVDTPPMQRLRSLKQLGCAEYVYMNVNHNRFEHSLGVSYLANTICRKIAQQQPSLRTTNKDILCITLAGLLHDIGHGPFSHSYEQYVLHDFPDYYQKNKHVQDIYQQQQSIHNWPTVPSDWTHECASLMMIDVTLAYLGLAIDIHQLDEPLKQIGDGIDAYTFRATSTSTGLGTTSEDMNDNKNNNDSDDTSMILTSRDWIFIKECIWGKPLPEIEALYGPGYHGRTEIYQDWLYDIVSNRHSGLDVDKIDYYARDQRRALRSSGEIDKLMIEEAIVAWAPCTDPIKCPRCRSNRYNNKNKHDTNLEMIKKKQKKYHRENGSSNFNDKQDSTQHHLMICYPDKMVGASMNFFKTRFELHSIIYKHKTNVGVAYMISDILCMADPHFLLSTAPITINTSTSSSSETNGNDSKQLLGIAKTEYDSLPLSRAMLHPMSYLRLRDSVIDQIEATSCKELEPARKLIHRLWSRDLYKCAITKVLKIHKVEKERRIWDLPPSWIVKGIVDLKAQHNDVNDGSMIQLVEYDIIVDKCLIHHGQKDKDPLTKMRFVDKNQLNKVSAPDNYYNLPQAKVRSDDEYESYLPRTLMECSLRIYCRNNKKIDLIRHAFELWWDTMNDEMEITKEEDVLQQQDYNNKRRRNNNGDDDVAVLSQDTDDDDENNTNQYYNEIDDNTTLGDGGSSNQHHQHHHFGDDNNSYPPWCSPN